MQPWKTYLTPFNPLIELLKRHPGIVALFGFVSGVASFLLVDRQAGLGRVIAIAMLLSWLVLLLEGVLTRILARWLGMQVPKAVLRYLTQMIHQESLFFILPFFFVTTAWNSEQALFTGLLGVAALVAIIDPLYYRWLARWRGLYLIYHTLTLFAVLLTVLPLIVHLDTSESYKLALLVASLLAFPSLASALAVQGLKRWLMLLGVCALMALGGWLARPWVPPATLWLTDVAVTRQMQNRSPGEGLKSISEAELRSGGLYAYTSINAPRGLDERVYHVWRYEGKEVDRIALDIHGGRKEGYRAWTHKQSFPAQVVGDWQVRVLTEDGQRIGMLRFSVTDGTAVAPPRDGRPTPQADPADAADTAAHEEAPAQEPQQPLPATEPEPESPNAAPAPPDGAPGTR
jgi:hypothetical protein